MSECRHPLIERHRSEEHDISLWGCTDCHRRFYPACEKCVSVGHRSGHGEHVEQKAAALDPELDPDDMAYALIHAMQVAGVWRDAKRGPFIDGITTEIIADYTRRVSDRLARLSLEDSAAPQGAEE